MESEEGKWRGKGREERGVGGVGEMEVGKEWGWGKWEWWRGGLWLGNEGGWVHEMKV